MAIYIEEQIEHAEGGFMETARKEINATIDENDEIVFGVNTICLKSPNETSWTFNVDDNGILETKKVS